MTVLKWFVPSDSPNLTGCILLAHPFLRDESFRRTMVFLVKHSSENGALGFILNRPRDRALEDLGLGSIPSQLAELTVHYGGPVAPENLILAFFEWDLMQEQWAIRHTIDPTEVDDLADARHTLAFAGYAGWNPGQLEEEIEGNSWVIHSLDDNPEHLFQATADTWKTLIGQHDPQLKMLAEIPDDPNLN